MRATIVPSAPRLLKSASSSSAWRQVLTVLSVLVSVTALQRPLQGALNAYLSLTLNGQNVKGSCTQQGRIDQIEVNGYEQLITAGSAGAQAGSIVILKPIDRSSPLLIQGLLSQQVAEGLIRFWRPSVSGKEDNFYYVVFKKGLITSIKQQILDNTEAGNLQRKPCEIVTFSVGSVEWTITDGGISAGTDPNSAGAAGNTADSNANSAGAAGSTAGSTGDSPGSAGNTAGSNANSAGAAGNTADSNANSAGAAGGTAGSNPNSAGTVAGSTGTNPLGPKPVGTAEKAAATQPADGTVVTFGQWYYTGDNKVALMVQPPSPAKAWSSGDALEADTSLMRASFFVRNDGSEVWHGINNMTLKFSLLDADGQTISGETHLFYPATGKTDGGYSILKGQRLNFAYDLAYSAKARPAELVVEGFETSLHYRLAGN